MAVDALGRGYDPVALIDPATGLPVAISGGGGGSAGATDNALSTYTVTSTGSQPGVLTTGYGAVLVELMGTFNASLTLQGSTDSTDGINGTWANLLGFVPEDAGSTAPTFSLSSAIRRRAFRAIDGMWVRVNASVFTSGTVVANIVRRTAPVSERGVYIGNSSLPSILQAGTNVVGSTTIRGIGTNRSATVGTAASVLMASNSGRFGWKIKNDSAGDIWINFDTTATAVAGGGNIKIAAGGYLASESGFVETGAMSVIGSAAGLNITAREH